MADVGGVFHAGRVMKKPTASASAGQASGEPLPFNHRPNVGRRGRDPLDYDHPYPSMKRYAELLALRYDQLRTRQAYYRQLRLIAEHGGGDPAELSEAQVRDYFLHVKTVKQWRPKTVRQAAACARLFFVDLLGHEQWTVFSQIRAKDDQRLPAVMTRPQVVKLLEHIRRRRYRIPVKLIYCCGLRLSECLNLTIHISAARRASCGCGRARAAVIGWCRSPR